ncbi:NAD-dependent epimerase/dehydratase family protein [Arsukibacterium indicum]|uniref:NAD(P)H-binding protein n=1 Tax=Arsukibacterium indicum TaxID=2848612 RepID=A0ABS6MHL9_9GAMM|nr:NAD-dependent epimerase/dehydratase family protein [Arsukibacterium indicum]MBV2128279.1 NAD(P)H-binding protein [Arsukibacterium indicum]
MTTILIIGLGELGSLVATEALQHDMTVFAMRRQAKCPAGVTLVQHDAATPWPVLTNGITDLVLCVSPDNSSDEAYRQAYLQVAERAICWLRQQPAPPHVWLVSSTGVYGQQEGEWVNENSPRLPERSSAKILVAAEELWLQSGQACTMLRPSGLYGPGREMMLRVARNGRQIIETKPVYTNRIHISDCARAVVHLIQRRQQGYTIETAYNLTDLTPARYCEVIQFLQQKMNITTNDQQVIERASKRVSARRLQQTGFRWQYPDYTTGYLAML